jgi:hypothetical protein
MSNAALRIAGQEPDAMCIKEVLVCAYCGRESDELHMDHVVPRSRGGPDTASNIVMACRPCNFEKRDSTASEWLGEQCPAVILEIERRVNERLQRKFAKRDYKNRERRKAEKESPALFAYSVLPNGGARFIGEVLSEQNGIIRMEVADAVMATGCGIWVRSGQIEDVPRGECKLFNDAQECLIQALQRNNRIYRGQDAWR